MNEKLNLLKVVDAWGLNHLEGHRPLSLIKITDMQSHLYIYTYTWNWDSIRMISIFQLGRLSFHSFLVQMAKTLQLKKSQVN